MDVESDNPFQLCALDYDIVEIGNQVRVLHNNMPNEYLSDIRSWKYPFLDALEVCANDPLYGSDHDSSKRVCCLEHLLDRLFAVIQFSGSAAEKTLAERSNQLTPTMQGKQSASAICQTFEMILKNCQLHSDDTTDKRKISVSTQQTEDNEIRSRNPCSRCLELSVFLDTLAGHLRGILAQFPESYTQVIPGCKLQDETASLRFLESVIITLANIRRSTDTLVVSSCTLQDKAAELDAVFYDLQSSCIGFASEIETQNNEAKQTNADKMAFSYDLSQLCAAITSLKSSLSVDRERNERLSLQIMKKSEILTRKRSHFAGLEQSLCAAMEAHRTELADYEQNYANICCELEKVGSALAEFDGFDRDWSSKAAVFQNRTKDVREEWHCFQKQILEQSREIEALQAEIFNSASRKSKISLGEGEPSDLGRSRSVDVLEDFTTETLLHLDQNMCGDVDRPITECGTHVTTSELAEEKGINTSHPTDIHALFSEFLEIPDVGKLPEWDLVSVTPDFGIAELPVVFHSIPNSVSQKERQTHPATEIKRWSPNDAAKVSLRHISKFPIKSDKVLARQSISTSGVLVRPDAKPAVKIGLPGLQPSAQKLRCMVPQKPMESAWIISKPTQQTVRK
ncbi:uncharacterized protein LOC129586800 [Paramacrobiotus metropolitanus]|uniref:uncharacterized protein LOC129586800 n=1 Tax=Paramacrobiotus metropolitanus TaxID=2943436 RepID=UPI0024464C61|nr:uncharacterized protein LOC129586800 [Paramacrobiotus metropolitanus]XP_055336206.1 uncharacterized protein LOC129586800 [Paramacrobiotus metropolitanus]XP_055336207.1 uncharacterized protein LOC129586800 [Paramacrobiotus metropolitanus]